MLSDRKIQPKPNSPSTASPRRSLKTDHNPATVEKLDDFIAPMIATLAKNPFTDANWLFEISLDGQRAIYNRSIEGISFYSPKGHSLLGAYSEISIQLEKIKHDMVIDGELVALNDPKLNTSISKRPTILNTQFAYYVFDILFLHGEDLRDHPLVERKELLKTLLSENANQLIRYREHGLTDGVSLYRNAETMQAKGIVAKKLDSMYISGKQSQDWLFIAIPGKRDATTIIKKQKSRRMPTAPEETILTIGTRRVKLTHTSKVYWPKEKITKGDMLNYYQSIAPTMLPYLKNRPMSLKRMPNGINEQSFFQKNAGEHFPEWIKTVPIEAPSANRTVNYTLCNDKATLLYLANLGSIEMNPWNSTVKSLDNPSYLILDIDPSGRNSFNQVIQTARVINDLLEEAGATSYCKTSGATGLHVYVPLNNKYSYDDARKFGKTVATLAQQQLPEFTSLERSLSKRGNRIYIDYLQNSKGQTIASAYSVRPVAGAQVSAPLLWKEVKDGLHPSQFNIFNMEKRVNKLGDVFYMALGKGINLHRCLAKLEH